MYKISPENCTKKILPEKNQLERIRPEYKIRPKFLLLATLIAALSAGIVSLPSLAQRTLVINLYQTGIKAYEKGNYREAMRIFTQCQELAKTTKHSNAEEAALLYSLGETKRSLGEYKEGEEYLKRSMSLTDSLPKFQRNYFFLFNGLALLYHAQGRMEEAEQLWKQAEASTNKANAKLMLFPINNLARHYYVWGKIKEETEYVEKSARLVKQDPKSLAVPYHEFNSAQLAEQLGQYKKAEELYLRSIESLKTFVAVKHPYGGLLLTSLAELYRKQGRYTEAEKCLRDALIVFETQYPSEHPDVSETMVKLGNVLCEEGKYTQAREIVKTALKNEEGLFGKGDNLYVARARVCLGNIYRQDGRYQDAQTMLEEALASQKRIVGTDNFEVATTMRSLAMVLEDEANYAEAESTLQGSLGIIERKTGPDHPERAAAAAALAHAYLRDQKYEEAEPLLQKALELSERVMGPDNSVTASGARDLGALYIKQKKFADAQTYLQKTLSIDEKLFGEKSPQIAGDLTMLASVYGEQGMSEKADPLLRRAAEIKNVLPGGAAKIEVPQIAEGAASDRPVSDKWALVVGISNFKDASINLKYAAKDATDFKNFLVNKEKFKPDHVKLLTNETASRENIIGMLGDKWLATHVKPDDMVVVYVSSHGSSAANEAGGTNFLVAHDTNKNSLVATGIPMQWLTTIVSEQVRSDRIILILDVCHSGAVGEGQKALSRTAGLDPTAMKIGKGQMVICSSLADQVSWESKNYENSVFTRCLMEALQSNEGNTTMLEAYKKLKTLVESEVLRDRGNLQTPMMVTKHWLGKDPVLAIDPANTTDKK